MRSASTARQPNIAASTYRNHHRGPMPNPMLHRASTDTGCVCSDGRWHLGVDCPEPDCTLPIDQKEATRRHTRL